MKNRKRNKKNNNKWILYATPIVALIMLILVMVISDTSTGIGIEHINPIDYQEQFSDVTHMLLDVRTPEEFVGGHIPSAVNISLQTLQNHLSEIPTDQPIVVYCRSGNRSASASQILIDAGYTQIYDMGGIQDWQAQGLPIE